MILLLKYQLRWDVETEIHNNLIRDSLMRLFERLHEVRVLRLQLYLLCRPLVFRASGGEDAARFSWLPARDLPSRRPP